MLPGDADAELDGGKLLADSGKAEIRLGEKDAVAGPQEFLALPETGLGRGQIAVLGHGFLDDLVNCGDLKTCHQSAAMVSP